MSEQIPYIPPEFSKSAFHCPHCGTYAHQEWAQPGTTVKGKVEGLMVAYCYRCLQELSEKENGAAFIYSIWYMGKMLYPDTMSVAPPNSDLAADIQDDYREAASILNKSARGAAALLRLCIQKLCMQLGEKGENLNTDIGNLVRKGLPVQIQQALDIVRVIGNNVVHPGQIDLKDDQSTAFTLFQLVNRIADDRITQPKLTQALYDSLPQTARDAIEKRDQS
jgi:uncharacterized protein DUF4145